VLTQNDEQIIIGDLAFGAGADGVPPSFELHISLTPEIQSWLIWHSNRATELPR